MLINEKTVSTCQFQTTTPKRHNTPLETNATDLQLKLLIAKLCNEEISGEYEYNEHNSPVFQLLFNFLRGIPCKIDNAKMVALNGVAGNGKSTIMSVFNKFLNIAYPIAPNNNFVISSTEEIVRYDQKELQDSRLLFNVTVNEHGVKKRAPRNILINEFGRLYEGSNFGTQYLDVMRMFVKVRYDIYQEYGCKTHITTNYRLEQLDDIFSDSILSDRFREMFHFIELKGKSFRK